MPKYLWKARYTTQGVQGILKEGGSSREAAVRKLAESVGGSLESFYFAFGGDDVYVIADLPDNESAATVALAVNSSGAVAVETVVLLTPSQVDTATKRVAEYRPPGQ